jgi:stage V sporulation protein D (sporulation-specific penicillin-binding protein)
MKEIVHTDSNNKSIKDAEYTNYGKKKILDSTIASNLRQYLVHVVADNSGVGHNAYIKGYDIAGKTGTAQKAAPNAGGYEVDKYMSSFAGMAPANNPRITLLVSIDEPDPSNYYAGQVAAPVAKDLFNKIFNFMKFKGEYDIDSAAKK